MRDMESQVMEFKAKVDEVAKEKDKVTRGLEERVMRESLLDSGHRYPPSSTA
jgi:hypothetical protein